MSDRPSFGRWLKEQRQALGLTQNGLAQRVGCATITIKRIEMETMRPSEQMVESILKHLEVPPSEVDALVRLARSRRPKTSPTLPAETDATPEPVAIRNPYKGLRAFVTADVADFFGRTALIDRLLARLVSSRSGLLDPPDWPEVEPGRFLAVVGPSGSGKSSVVRAGVVPALHEGLLPGSEHWTVLEMLPGSHPFEELESSLLRVAVNPPGSLLEQLHQDERGLLRAIKRILPADPNCELVLVIDQFEELFTLVRDEQTRQRFINSLITAVTEARSCVRLIITLRADFYDRPLCYDALGDLMRQSTEVVLPMTADELEQAIVGPATRVGLELERDLVLTIIRDVRSQPGALPLMQYALTELFEHRNGSTLTRQVYEASGGVTGALAHRADELYTSLDPTHQEAARRLFLRLITPGDGVPDTRRRMRMVELGINTIDELLSSLPPNNDQTTNVSELPLAQVIERFSRYRLLTLDYDPIDRSPTVEIAHEALITTWQRLQHWIDENRVGLRIHRRLTEAAREWERLGHDDDALYRGVRLEQAQEWMRDHSGDVNDLEQRFLHASRHAAQEAVRQQEAARERELAQARALAEEQQRRIEEQTSSSQRLRRRALFLVATAVLAMAAALTAGVLGIQAQRRGSEAQGLALTAASQAALGQGNIDQAIALGLAAVRADSLAAQAEVTLSQAAYTPGTRHIFSGHEDEVWGVDFSPDGQQAVSSSEDGTLRLWDVATGAELRVLEGHTDGVEEVVWSPDGRYLLSGSLDGTLRLWDADTGAEIRIYKGHMDAVHDVAFSSDSRYALSGSTDTTVRLWDVVSGEEVRRFEGHTDKVNAVAFSPDGQTVFSGASDHTTRIWAVESGEERIQLQDDARVFSLAVSPDGQYLLIGTSNTTVQLWDIASGEEVRQLGGHTEAPIDMTFSHDGKLALVGTFDNQLRLWDVEHGRELHRFEGHIREVLAVAFSPDDRLALSGARDGSIRLWDVANGAELRRYQNDAAIGTMHMGNADSDLVAVADIETVGKLLDITTGQVLRELHGHEDMLLHMVLSHDEQRVLSSSYDTTVRLWDAASGTELRRFDVDQVAWRLALSSDGYTVAAGLWDGSIELWHLIGDQQRQRLTGHDATVSSLAFSPDDQTILSGSWDGTLRLWDRATGSPIHTFEGHALGVNSVAFSPDGRSVLSGASDTTLRLWDIASGAEVRRFEGHTAVVWAVAYSRDGRLIASGSEDGTVRLWDVATGQELRRYTGHQSRITDVVFSADDTTIISGSPDATLRVWRIDTLPELVTWTCTHRHVPLLTTEQRQLYTIGYTPLCPTH